MHLPHADCKSVSPLRNMRPHLQSLASRPGAAPGRNGFGSSNRIAIPQNRRHHLSLATPDKPFRTAGAATFKFDDEYETALDLLAKFRIPFRHPGDCRRGLDLLFF